MILSTHVLRQLWLQLRLLPLVALPPLAALVAVAVLDVSGSAEARRALAIGFAIAVMLSAALTGVAFTVEIASGAAAWLVVRAISRTRLLGAWFGIPVLLVAMAFVVAGLQVGLALPAPPDRMGDPVTVLVAVAAAAAPVLPLTGAALACAVHLGSRVTFAAVLVMSGLGAALALALGTSAVHPASGYWLVAGVAPADLPLAVGLQTIGLCLVLGAAAWVIATWLFARRDL